MGRDLYEAHPVFAQVIDEAAQHLCQLENMDTGTAVNVGRVFAGKKIDAHDVVLPTVATRVTHSIGNHRDRNRNETVEQSIDICNTV